MNDDSMPGMNMSGSSKKKTKKIGRPNSRNLVPGMKMQGSSMPGMNMPGMNKPGVNKPGMDMSGMDMSGMDMPGMLMPSVAPLKDVPEQQLNKWLSAAPAPSADQLSLADLEKLAEQHNPTLVQARAQIEGESGQALQAGLYPNPGITYNGDLMGLPGPGNGAGEFQGGIVQQEIILGGKLKLSREKYKARTEAARRQYDAQKFRVSNDVKINYYHALGALERLKMQKELLKTHQDRWLTISEMINLGEANIADGHKANVMLEQQKLKVKEAENDLNCTWQELTTSVGVDLPYRQLTGSLDGDAQDIGWEPTLKRLIQNSPEMAQAKEKLKSDEITLKREKRQWIPNLVLSGGAGFDPLDKGFASKANFNIVGLPLFDRNQGTVQQAQADLSRQHAQVALTELQLRRTLAQQYRNYLTAVQHVQAYKSVILPESEKRYVALLNGYRNTRTDWPTVLEAQKDFFDHRLAFIHDLVEWREAETAINGFVLSGALVPPAGVNPPGHIDAVSKPR